MGERLTRNELTKAWGVSRSRIDNMVSAKQLKVGKDGRIDLDEANAVRASFDPARVEQAANAAISKGKAGPEKEAIGGNLYKAREIEATARAKLKTMEVQERMGALVERHKVKDITMSAARIMVSRLMAMPGRLAPMLAHETDANKCRVLIDKEVKQIVTELQEKLAEI